VVHLVDHNYIADDRSMAAQAELEDENVAAAAAAVDRAGDGGDGYATVEEFFIYKED
jgi:hypothetical protein